MVTAHAVMRRSLTVGLAAALLASVSACGAQDTASQAEGQGGSQGSPATGEQLGDDFCDAVQGIEHDLAMLDMTDWGDDPQAFVAQISTAAERFSGSEPPEPIAASWELLGEFFTMADDALQGVEVTGEDDLRQALRFEDEEAFAMVIQFPGHAETVGVFVQENCGVDLGIVPPAIANVCDALDPIHLGSVFDAVPEGEHRRWGEGVVECFWNDEQGNEVGVVVGPAASIRPDLLDGQNPIDHVQVDDGSIEVYDGALGPLRAAAGRTAAIDVEGSTVMASVRTGDAPAEAMKAIALADLVSIELL